MTPDTPDPAADFDAKLAAAAARVADQVRPLIDPGQVVELRALRVQDGTKGGSTWAGTFAGDDLPALCTWALKLSGNCSGVYFTLNPLKPHRLTNPAGRVGKATKGLLATDADVLCRRWVLIDVDPVRPKGHEKDSATDADKDAARGVMAAVREYLAGEGSDWPTPIVADSGNGYHLLYRLDDAPLTRLPLPEDDPLRQFLRHLADKFDTPAATIDTSVFNPSRIVKFPGTLTCKGSGEGDRPHRRARILEVPT
jgi:hypothetical protein